MCDNHYIEPPRRPEEGYHLSEDLADQAVRMVQDQQQGAPGKPYFLYFALGAMHAPHHVAPEWVDPYRGVFDKGWDAWREEVFARQLASGMVPDGTVLTERPEWVQAWSDLSGEERRMLARQQEVFAGFLTHTDAQIGRVLSSLEDLGALDNTLVMVFSDNGASAEGGKAGSFNEHRFTAHVRESMDENLAHYDDWGGFSTYNHYSWAWAWAGNTPHKLWKRYTWLGGTRTPLIVHWPGRIAQPGTVRAQFAHAIDLMPTIMGAVGLELPDEVDGVAQQPVDGVSLLLHAGGPGDRRAAPDPVLRDDGLALHLPRGMEGHDQPHQHRHPRRGGAGRRQPRLRRGPLGALRPLGRLLRSARPRRRGAGARCSSCATCGTPRRSATMSCRSPTAWSTASGASSRRPGPPGPSRTFRPGGGPVADESVPLLWGGFDITADVDTDRDGAGGVVFALGDWFGGYALYLVDGQGPLHLRPGRRRARADDAAATGGRPPRRHRVLRRGRAAVARAAWCCASTGPRSTRRRWRACCRWPSSTAGRACASAGTAASRCRRATRRPPRFDGTVHGVRVDTPGSLRPDPADEVRAALHAD